MATQQMLIACDDRTNSSPARVVLGPTARQGDTGLPQPPNLLIKPLNALSGSGIR
jgi:hypothetical protein